MKVNQQFIFLFLLPFVAVQSQTISFRHLTAEDGLSQNTINCIYQDHFGFMWFGTQDFTTFHHDPLNLKSLASDGVYSILSDEGT